MRPGSRARDASGERGMATLVAVVCLLVILTLTTVAVRQSVGALSSFAQGRKLLQTVDAAEAGIQAEISTMERWLSSPALTLPCPGGSPTTGLPAGGWVPAGSSSPDSAVNAASLGYYSLAVATYAAEPSGTPQPLPQSDDCYGRTILAPVGASSWYMVVQSRGVSSATTGGSTAMGRTLQALLLVDEPALASYRHRGAGLNAGSGIELVAFHSQTTSTYTSNASAQAVNFSPVSTPTNTASYSGAGPPDANSASSSQPSPSPFTTESWLTLGALSQYAEADSSGTSVSCSGLVAAPGTIPVGSGNTSCSTSGSPGPTGVKLDLSTVPAVGTTVSTLADVTLETSAITSTASMGVGGAPMTGSASLGSMYVRVAVPLGNTVTIPLTLSTAPNQDLLSVVTNAISSDAAAIGPVTSSLVTTLQTTFTLTSNYQNASGGVFTVSALHLTIPSAAITADLAKSTVGPNTYASASPSTTTTTVAPTPTTVPPTTTTLPPNDLTVIWIKQVP